MNGGILKLVNEVPEPPNQVITIKNMTVNKKLFPESLSNEGFSIVTYLKSRLPEFKS